MFIYTSDQDGYTVRTGHQGHAVITRPTVRAALNDCHRLYRSGLGFTRTEQGTELNLPDGITTVTDHGYALEILATAAHTYLTSTQEN